MLSEKSPLSALLSTSSFSGSGNVLEKGRKHVLGFVIED
jgi:hypothetical protein